MKKRMVLLLSLITIGSMASSTLAYAEEVDRQEIVLESYNENKEPGEVGGLDTASENIVNNDSSGIPDKALYEALVAEVGGDDGVLLKNELETIFDLDVQGKGISNLKGLEYCTNLNFLCLYNNKISDISPLSKLKNLETLWLGNNSITDINALSGMEKLCGLQLENNSISDISAVATLINLESLNVSGNKITKLPKLTGLTNLDPSHYGPFDYAWFVLFSGNEIKMEDAKANLPAQLMNNVEWVDRQGFVISETIYKEQLTEKIEVVDNASLIESEYTAESWNKYKEAVKYAKMILSKSDATEEEYKNALIALENAEIGLKKIDKDDTVNNDNKNDTQDKESNTTVQGNTSKAPKTGDNNSIVVLAILMLGSLMVVGTLCVRKRTY